MRSHWAMLAAPCLFFASCGELPDRQVGFDSSDPAGRVDALRAAALNGDRSAVPGLVRMLRSDDPAQRMLANRALISITAQDFGFDHAAPEGDRLLSVQRWEEWVRNAQPPFKSIAPAARADAEPAPSGAVPGSLTRR